MWSAVYTHGLPKAAKRGVLKVGPKQWPVLMHRELKNRPDRPVQVAYRVFNRDQIVRDGQCICVLHIVLHIVDLIFDSIVFYHNSESASDAPPGVEALVAVNRRVRQI